MRQSNTAFRDTQVKIVIKENNGIYINELVRKCKEYFPLFTWDYNRVYHSIERIIAKNPNVKIEKGIIISTYMQRGKMVKSPKYINRVVVSNVKLNGK